MSELNTLTDCWAEIERLTALAGRLAEENISYVDQLNEALAVKDAAAIFVQELGHEAAFEHLLATLAAADKCTAHNWALPCARCAQNKGDA